MLVLQFWKETRQVHVSDNGDDIYIYIYLDYRLDYYFHDLIGIRNSSYSNQYISKETAIFFKTLCLKGH